MSRVIRTTMPNAPRPTGMPSKPSSSLVACLISPSAATYSMPAIAADRILLPLLEPGVAGEGEWGRGAEVGQRPAVSFQPGREHAVGGAGAHGHRPCRFVDYRVGG